MQMCFLYSIPIQFLCLIHLSWSNKKRHLLQKLQRSREIGERSEIGNYKQIAVKQDKRTLLCQIWLRIEKCVFFLCAMNATSSEWWAALSDSRNIKALPLRLIWSCSWNSALLRQQTGFRRLLQILHIGQKHQRTIQTHTNWISLRSFPAASLIDVILSLDGVTAGVLLTFKQGSREQESTQQLPGLNISGPLCSGGRARSYAPQGHGRSNQRFSSRERKKRH